MLICIGNAVQTFVGETTQVIDLDGRLVIPGLNDSHLHMSLEANQVYGVDLSHARSIDEIVQAVSERAEQTPPGEWIIGKSNWHEGSLKEGRLPTRSELDQATIVHPVIIHRGGHVITVNSVALELAGITKETPNPPSGVIVRDAAGHPTGIIFGRPAAELVWRHLPDKSMDERADELRAIMHRLNQFGITAVTDPLVSDEEIDLYRRVWRNEEMTIRTTLLYVVESVQDVKEVSAKYVQGEGDDFLSIGGLKYFSDGGIENAYMKEPYEIVPGEQEDPNYRGELRVPPGGKQELYEMFQLIAEKGWSVGIHSVGDWAIDEMVKLYAAVNERIPIKDLRWAILHLFHPSDENIQTMREIGILSTVQALPLLLGHNQRRFHGEERARNSIPLRKLVDSGIVLGGGTDAPVIPPNPFYSLWWMVTRNTFTAGVLGPEHAITREEALYLYTMGSAMTQFKEDKIGSIEPGKYADLAVLSEDYFEVEYDEIKDIKSLLTMVEGKIVHQDERLQIKASL